MPNHRIEMMDETGRPYTTLEDVFPNQRPRMLIVGKVPAPNSVETGHYLQGTMGQGFWSRLREYKLFEAPAGVHNDIGEDDFLVQNGYGITDVVKKPREFRQEPTEQEYRDGAEVLLRKIEQLKPYVVLFIFKRSFDRILQLHFQIAEHSRYGFNNEHSPLFFGSSLFVFPMSGTPATMNEITRSMNDLKSYMDKEKCPVV